MNQLIDTKGRTKSSQRGWRVEVLKRASSWSRCILTKRGNRNQGTFWERERVRLSLCYQVDLVTRLNTLGEFEHLPSLITFKLTATFTYIGECVFGGGKQQLFLNFSLCNVISEGQLSDDTVETLVAIKSTFAWIISLPLSVLLEQLYIRLSTRVSLQFVLVLQSQQI